MLGPIETVLQRSAIKGMMQSAGGYGQELDWFGQLYESQRDIFVDAFEQVSCEEGEVIVTRGAGAQFILIIQGQVAVVTDESVKLLVQAPQTEQDGPLRMRPLCGSCSGYQQK